VALHFELFANKDFQRTDVTKIMHFRVPVLYVWPLDT